MQKLNKYRAAVLANTNGQLCVSVSNVFITLRAGELRARQAINGMFALIFSLLFLLS